MSQVPSTATSSTSFERIFTAALKAYRKRTGKDITSHPLAAQLQSCDSPRAILDVLQAQVQASDQSQRENEKLTKWLDPTVNVLYAFSMTLGSGIGLMFPPSNAIFAGIGVLLQTIKDVRASQNALVDLFCRLEFFFKRLEQYIKVQPTAVMIDIIVKIVVEVLSILGILTKEIGRGRTRTYLMKLIGRKDVEDALQRLDALTQEEVRMAAAEALTFTRGIDDRVKDVDDKVKDVGEHVDGVDERVRGVDMKVEGIDDMVRSIDSRVKGVDHKLSLVIQGVNENGVAIQQVIDQVTDLNRNELRKGLRKWIAPPDPSVNYNTASDAHQEGTAAWCTEGITLANWKTSGALLWVYGKPGSGKSILSSVIIRHIKSMSNAFLAYFYFDFKDTTKQDSRALLSSLLVQLSDQSDMFCGSLSSLYSAHKRGSEQPTVDSLAQCLRDTLMIIGQMSIYLVIDALDECPNDSGIPSSREKVLELVKELIELRHPTLRLCITSRPEFDIRTTLEPLATQQVSLHDESGQKKDIDDYVTFVVHSDRRMKKWREDDKDAVIENLTEKADGMFRWVFCQLEVLRHCFPSNLRRVLEELPKSLDETYKRILKEINNANREHAYRILQCLTVARRPLRVEELAEVLAVDFNTGGAPKLNASWRWEDQGEAVLSACSSLVSIISDKGSLVVQFSHFSVKEFLVSDRLASCMEEVSRFHIPLESSHAVLAQACLGTLLRLDDRTDEDSVKEIPLFQYASVYWVKHAVVGEMELQTKDAMDHFFDTDKPHFSAWVRIEGVYDLLKVSRSERPRAVPLSAAPLYFAAEKGSRGLVEHLVTKYPQQVNHLGGRRGTPLHASVFFGHIEVAQLLHTHGADINSRSADDITPLHLASQLGDIEIGKWLLDLGADANVRDKLGMTPLSFTASQGQLEVARLLLNRNVEVEARDVNRDTPLLHASRSGYPDVVRLLLDHNAVAHAPNNKGTTPLHYAAHRGHIGVVRLLLEHSAEVDAPNGDGATPLIGASKAGHPDVVQLLLGHSADIHFRDNQGRTPLYYAAALGHLEVSRLLLLARNAQADVRDVSTGGLTPLHRASQNGHLDVVRLFLDHSADVHIRSKSGKTPLHYAAAQGHLKVTQILLEHNAEVNAQDDKGSTPLHLTGNGWWGTPEVVQLLLDKGADVQVRDLNGKTPSEVACGPKQREIVQLLSQHSTE